MALKLAISSYSFHRFGEGKEGQERPTFQAMIERCAELGLDGIELLGVHFKSTEAEELRALKQHAGQHGIAIVSVSAHHNFVNPDPQKRLQQIDIIAKWVDVAGALGAPFVRAFGGRWATRPRFADFMAADGVEPPLEGYTDDDGYAWSAEAFKIASYYAGRRGVTLALENHWGFTGTAAGVLRILRATDSPWLKVALDTGNFNFRPDQYGELAELAPYAAMVHAKTYVGGGMYYTADLDYRRIGKMLRDVGFSGYVSIEFEGRAHPDQGIPESVAMLREALGE
ncbi:MAG TPA: sugar phosphate isomerase/epimerase family protein [Chloroflexota bacterium]|nr:sugar phosphate isomerase/epimerase family protein [Chloroflexota bacterium]